MRFERSAGERQPSKSADDRPSVGFYAAVSLAKNEVLLVDSSGVVDIDDGISTFPSYRTDEIGPMNGPTRGMDAAGRILNEWARDGQPA
jgi:hypothetical protein